MRPVIGITPDLGQTSARPGRPATPQYELKQAYTIVLVTHNMQQAARVADFTGFFYLGRLVEFGETEQVFTRPTDERTEAYITGRFG